MKTCLKNRVALSVLIPVLGLASVAESAAQVFKPMATNVQPVIVSGNTIYGFSPPSAASGTIVALNTDGTGLRTLYAFTPTDPSTGWTNSDGDAPSGLTLSGSTLYGSCLLGGGSGNGTLFKLNTDGTAFTLLYSFVDENSDGNGPAPLILDGNILYGTTSGGASGAGTVFSIGADGSGFTTLYSFSATDPSTLINSDGAYPTKTQLTLSGQTLYGATQAGGIWGRGTVFAVNTDGTGFTTLHSFTAIKPGPAGCGYTSGPNIDGADPSGRAGLILSSNTLYGTAYYGGHFGNGTVFALRTDGTGFTVLHDFSPYANCSSMINSDGGNPLYTLVLSGTTLYGTTYHGGSSGSGVVFALNTDGSGFKNLHNFDGMTQGPLVVSGNNLFGLYFSTSRSDNLLFSIALPIGPPALSIVPAGANVILTWPTNTAGLTLQSTTDLTSSFWTTNSAAPVIVNGQYTVTNPISGTQEFYRLSQ